MTGADFHHALRILNCLGLENLREAGVIDENWGTPEASNRDQVGAFFDNPYRETLRMPDANYDRLWSLIEAKLQNRRER